MRSGPFLLSGGHVKPCRFFRSARLPRPNDLPVSALGHAERRILIRPIVWFIPRRKSGWCSLPVHFRFWKETVSPWMSLRGGSQSFGQEPLTSFAGLIRGTLSARGSPGHWRPRHISPPEAAYSISAVAQCIWRGPFHLAASTSRVTSSREMIEPSWRI